jgi:ParB-like chromosome segregation protein Spo0J
MDRARSGYDAKLRSVARFRPAVTPATKQPISEVTWVDRKLLRGNLYNPNVIPPPEFKLLKVSLLTDGWTAPIVTRQDGGLYEVVDGFHRWLLSEDPDVSAMTDGLVPIVVIAPKAGEDQQMSTIRHNRARGNHHVLQMAEIVAEMLKKGIEPERIGELLQMEPEEVERLRDRGNMLVRGPGEDFSKGWKPA